LNGDMVIHRKGLIIAPYWNWN